MKQILARILMAGAACALTACGAQGERSAAKVPEKQPVVAPEFIPSRDGFAFTNSFTGSPLPGAVRGSPLGALVSEYADDVGLDVPSEFGFCGGMCAAAADYWNLKRSPAWRGAPPREGDPLYDYLRERNADSLGVAGVMALKFIDWMALPEVGEGQCTAALTATELDSIVERVGTRGYAHLGLVYVDSKRGKPWQNHQVLACKVDECSDTRIVLRLYDPNMPGDDRVQLVITRSRDASGRELAKVEEISSRRRIHVRGFFPMPYEPKVPPAEIEKYNAPT